MHPLTSPRFAEVVGGRLLEPGEPVDISAVTIHSGRIPAGAAFFALVGRRADGHDFVPEALRNGAGVVVVDESAVPAGVPGSRVVVVPDTLRALQRLAGWWRTQLSATVVAVTGSNGKTTTKDALVHFAASLGLVHGSPGSYNSQLGVALALLQCPADADVAIIEAAGSRPGDLESLAALIDPDHLVVTNVGVRWAVNFPDRRTRIRSLLAPGAELARDAWLLLGDDDPELGKLAGEHPARVLTVGRSADLPTFGDMARSERAVSFPMTLPDGTAQEVRLSTPSVEIATDAQLALSAAWLLGVDAKALTAAVDSYLPTATRTEIWRTPRGVTLVRDVATADPIALGSVIRSARSVAGDPRRLAAVLTEPPADWPAFAEDAILASLLDEGVHTIDAVDHPRYRRLRDAAAGAPDVVVALHPDAAALRGRLVERSAAGDVVLVQAPRDRELPDLSVELLESMAATRLYVDLSALEENLSRFRRLVGPSVRILAMVKALAYGTDSVAVAASLQDAGADMLGVSTADEGVALRRHGVHLPVLVMAPLPADLDKVLHHGLVPMVYSRELLDEVVRRYADSPEPVTVHLEVDTGMHRAGLLPAEAVQALRDLRAVRGVRLAGLMTHFAVADDPAQDDATHLQLRRFGTVLRAAEELGFEDVVRHAANTAATLRFPEAHFDMVRIGIGLHGIAPSPAAAERLPLAPVFSLRSRVIKVIEVEPGEAVGYGRTFWATTEPRRIGLVPAGYEDCVPRALSNRGYVVVDGLRCPIAGTVSMDSMTVDLTAHPSAGVGSEVLIYGRHDAAYVPIGEVADTIGTIPYELMTRFGARVQRIFTRH